MPKKVNNRSGEAVSLLPGFIESVSPTARREQVSTSANSATDDEQGHPRGGSALEGASQDRTAAPRINGPVRLEQEFFIPVHGFVLLTLEEVRIIDHPALQRLGDVFQLGQAHLHFRGASHMRLEHAVGTVAVAQQMIDAIAKNHRQKTTGKIEVRVGALGRPLEPREESFTRLGALLHDLGHLPAGHTLEDELGLLPTHDSLHRLDLILDRTEWLSGNVESLRTVINDLYAHHLAGTNLTPVDVLLRIIAKDYSPTPVVPNEIVRVEVCRDIVGNTICADLLDYLHRDWHHVGKTRYFERRLYQYMEIREQEAGRPAFVISLGHRPRIRTDAVSAILELLESRYQLAEIVLFHHTKCAAAAMLERGIQELELSVPTETREGWYRELESTLLEMSDSGMLDYLLSRSEPGSGAHRPLSALRGRRIYKALYTRFWGEFPDVDFVNSVAHLYSPGSSDASGGLGISQSARRRRQVASMLETDFDLPPGSLTVYCPERRMNSKIAEVKICVNDSVAKLCDWEQDNGDILSGGHLAAQQDRFRRLWRFHVFMDRTLYASMQEQHDLRLPLLPQAIDQLVLGITADNVSVEDAAQLLAVQLSCIPQSFLYRQDVIGALLAAQDRSNKPVNPRYTELYPTGAPTLRSFARQ